MSGGNWIAIVAVVASMLTVTYSAYRTQQLAREERRQARISETYVILMNYAIRADHYASAEGDPEILPFTEEELLKLGARVLAFSSDEVRLLFGELSESWEKTRSAHVVWIEVRGAHQANATPGQEWQQTYSDVEERRKVLGQHAKAVVEQVRHELGSQSRFRSKSWWRRP